MRWRSLRVSHPQRAARRRAVKNVTLWRTGSAGCVVDTIVLVYGGTLNGNIGPYCDDLLVLSFDIRAAASLFARADAEDSRASPRINVNDAGVVNPEESPGARRGHTMTTVLRPAGSDGKAHEHDAAVVIGGWVARADTDVTHTGAAPMHPMLLVLDHMEGGLRGEPVDARPTFRWVTPEVAGMPPSPRAFHSATHIGGSRIGVGGLLDGESSCSFHPLHRQHGVGPHDHRRHAEADAARRPRRAVAAGRPPPRRRPAPPLRRHLAHEHARRHEALRPRRTSASRRRASTRPAAGTVL